MLNNYKKTNKMKNTKDIGIDLFEDYTNIPAKVQTILDKYEDAFVDGDYKQLEKAHKALNKIGYTFEYYLDGQAYDLRPVGTKGKSEMNEFKTGGVVKFYNKDNEHRLARPSGSIEKEILNKVRYDSIKQNFVGSFGWKTIYNKLGDGYLYKLDEYDQDLIKNIPLKAEERIYRYINRTTAIGGISPLIKMNIEKGLLYFPVYNEADDIIFETRGIKALWISLIEDKYAKGGSLDKENSDMVLNNNKQIAHHTKELANAVNKNKNIPAWVVAKVNRSATDISDATHYLEGAKYKKGGKLGFCYSIGGL